MWWNPPYGPATKVWLEKLAAHGSGTALVLSRTDTKWFHKAVNDADAILFLEGRLKHLKPGLVEPKGKSGATCGSVLMAFGEFDADMLMRSDLKGFKIDLRSFV